MRLSARFAFAAFLVLAPLPALRAQFAQFVISQDGQAVGVASFEFKGSSQGFESGSMVRIATKELEYHLSKTEQLTATDHLRSAMLSAMVNGAAVSMACTSKKAQIALDYLVDGKNLTTRLAAHGVAVLMPEFDPGALETLLTLALTEDDHDLVAILPKGTGLIEPIELEKRADEQGTLDGAAIVVHHLVATIAGARTNLFSGSDNQLLQAELPQKGFALVRKGFVLKQSAQPATAAQ